jgi:hypothetical protein
MRMTDNRIMSRSETILKAERTQSNESVESMQGKSLVRVSSCNAQREN